ncbi:DUF2993 domain-containing protein [Propionibacterium sp.]|uniref:LmeA family phospholipid-binding protein n=1 Tax=Propionibacterium sp. TaxID=1977903 RepID=UPI0039E85882
MTDQQSPSGQQIAPGKPIRHGSHRRLVVVLVVIALFVAAFLVVNEYVKDRAQTQFSRQITSQLGSSQPAEAHIEDWPFLLSLARNQLGHAEVSVGPTPLSFDGHDLNLDSADVDIRGLAPMTGSDQTHAESLDGSVVIGWAEVSRITGVTMSLAGDNKVGASTKFNGFGVSVQANIVATLVLADSSGQLSLVDPTAQVAGVQVPSDIVTGAASRIRSKMVLPALPGGLSYSGISVDSRGVVLQVHGNNVDLSQLR